MDNRESQNVCFVIQHIETKMLFSATKTGPKPIRYIGPCAYDDNGEPIFDLKYAYYSYDLAGCHAACSDLNLFTQQKHQIKTLRY
jgi:hypothetical protein